MKTVLVCGGGGFIGNHLVSFLKAQGYWVRAADRQTPPFSASEADDYVLTDLRDLNNCLRVTRGIQLVFQTSAEVGGLGFIHDGSHSLIARNNVLINSHMLEASRMQGVERLLFTSSAVVYPQYLQRQPDVTALVEDTVWPADPAEGGYGLEKLFTEQLCRYYHEEGLLQTRVARLHNSYGIHGAYDGGKEKAPAALCRKVACAKLGFSIGESNPDGTYTHMLYPTPTIEIWGDGTQTRSFTYVDDTVEGLYRLMMSDYAGPLNIGSSELTTINAMVDLIADIAGVTVEKRYLLDKPVGVLGRNSDNSRIRDVLGWEPSTSLAEGLAKTYPWIEQQVMKRAKVAA